MPSLSASDSSAFGPVAPFYDTLMAGVPYRFWVDYIARVWTQHGLTPYTILDLACGTGTVSRLLARRGYQVVGVDLSPGMLQTARGRASDERLAIPFYQQDAAELTLDEPPFDAAVSLFDSLNYILEPERLAQACTQVCRHLAPGGSFLFDLNTEYALAEGMFTQSNKGEKDDLQYDWKSSYDRETRLCTVQMHFSYSGEDGVMRPFTEIHRQRAYHKDEMFALLQKSGFDEIVAYDAYTLNKPKKRSDRLFYLALKRQT
jgi:SAM-dependent methyltransferase